MWCKSPRKLSLCENFRIIHVSHGVFFYSNLSESTGLAVAALIDW